MVKLKPKHKVTQAPKGTEALEGFLKTLENELLLVLFDKTKVIKQTEKNKKITKIHKVLAHPVLRCMQVPVNLY